MASCVKCGAVLVAQARFCATCGSPVTHGSSAPPPPSTKNPATSAPDPFAQTVMGDSASPAVAALVAQLNANAAQPVSPLAASHMTPRSQPPPAPQPAAAPASAYAPQPSPGPAPGPAQLGPPLPQQSHGYVPGTLVLVYWANGQRYPGTILQVSAHHVFVAFPNGMQQWIDARYVTVGA